MNNFSTIATTGGSRTAATSKIEHFVIIVNDFKPLSIITKSSILDVAAVLAPPLVTQTLHFRLSFAQQYFICYHQ